MWSSRRKAEMAEKSGALKFQSKWYPAEWKGCVPKKVMVKRVPEVLVMMGLDVPVVGDTYFCYVNHHGSLDVIMDSGVLFYLKPGWFEVTMWHRPKKRRQ